MIITEAFKVKYNDKDYIIFEMTPHAVVTATGCPYDEVYNILNTLEAGFIENEGAFLTPKEALINAMESEQVQTALLPVIEANKLDKLQSYMLKRL